MLATTASFMVQFSLTPNVIGKVLPLGKLGMRFNAIRKVAENIEKGIKFTEKSRSRPDIKGRVSPNKGKTKKNE